MLNTNLIATSRSLPMKLHITIGLTATLLVAGNTFCAKALEAAPYEMSVLEGYASSHALLDGKLERALKLAEDGRTSKLTTTRVANEVTRCVTLAKIGELQNAEISCELAAREAGDLTPRALQRMGMNKRSAEVFLSAVDQNLSIVRELRTTR